MLQMGHKCSLKQDAVGAFTWAPLYYEEYLSMHVSSVFGDR